MKKGIIKSLLIATLLFIGGQSQYSASNIILENPKVQATANPVITISDKNFEKCILETTFIEEAQYITVLNLESINYLSCYDYGIQDISEISYFKNIQMLELKENQISDISALENLTSMQYLALENNLISDISSLSNLEEIYYLELSSNKISDISPLSGLPKIRYLMLQDNQISDISSLSGMENTYFLFLDRNQISNLDSLSDLTQLDYVSLSGNQISDVTVLSRLINLQDLNLDYNQISDISPLSSLEIINTLSVENQEINLKDLTVSNDGEISYEVIDLEGNIEKLILGHPVNGTITLSANWSNPIAGSYYLFSGKVIQTVTYADLIIENDVVSINEGTVLNSAELIELFGVVNQGGFDIELDMSSIDFNTPGNYSVVFTSNSNSYNGVLTIVDLLPELIVNQDMVTIEVGANLQNILNQLTVESTEINSGDLNSSIVFDDSAVDYNKAGSYQLVITSTDNEGNTASKSITVVVEKQLSELTGYDSVAISEHTVVDEASLINLFEVTNSDGEKISVDYSLVDTTTPGVYTVKFTDESGNILICELQITDILPVLDVEQTEVSIKVGESLEDLIAKLSVSATEITSGDLNSRIVFDDSAIDYNKAGIYQLVITVTDIEGNIVEKLLNVTVMPDEVITTPEVEEPSAEEPQVKEEITVEKKVLSQTGDLIIIATIILLALLFVIVCVKKFINRK